MESKKRLKIDEMVGSNLGFAEELAVFKGATQNARALSEGWIGWRRRQPQPDGHGL